MTGPASAAPLLLSAAALLVVPGGRSHSLLLLDPPPSGWRSRRGGGSAGPHTARAGTVSRVGRSRVVAGGVGAAVALVIGWPLGLPLGAGTGVVVARVLARLEPATVRRLREQRLAALPDALNLLAAALTAGLPVSAAVTAVAGVVGGPLAVELARVGDLYALGAGPAAAWADVAADPVLGPAARAAARSADSGSALAGAFQRLAADTRADGQVRAESAARRAGVLAMAPLGLCFLPAFVCLGVAPIAIGLAQQVLH
jgi:Flp pilus assembly protein TadB